LSRVEQSQLGRRRRLKNGELTGYSHPTERQWPGVRNFLVMRAQAANPHLDRELTAYTPGETLDLLKHPTVRAWHRQVAKLELPRDASLVVLVPCAKTKPWSGTAASRSRMYTAYNRLQSEFPGVVFVTVSEPLGLVPSSRWADFPQYDNPGLFRDDAQRSGMTTAQWQASPWKRKYLIPFDEMAYQECIEKLSDVIAGFMERNRSARFIAFTDNLDGSLSTHSDMLRRACVKAGVEVECHPKRARPHESPYGPIRERLSQILGVRQPAAVTASSGLAGPGSNT
jgi:hypothetical protein